MFRRGHKHGIHVFARVSLVPALLMVPTKTQLFLFLSPGQICCICFILWAPLEGELATSAEFLFFNALLQGWQGWIYLKILYKNNVGCGVEGKGAVFFLGLGLWHLAQSLMKSLIECPILALGHGAPLESVRTAVYQGRFPRTM